MKNMLCCVIRILSCACCLAVVAACSDGMKREVRILVFTKTEDYRHASITAGIHMFKELGRMHGVHVDVSEDASIFTDDSLSRYSALVFMNTTGDILDHAQQCAMERYIQAGGGFVGIHGASGAEYTWPWYGRLVGAWFESHPPELQEADIYVVDTDHPATQGLPLPWTIREEWYNFRSMSPDLLVLARVNESSYSGGKHGDNHPVAWCHDFDGGRAFYTALGHETEAYGDTLFRKHVWGGVQYAIGDNRPLDYGKATTNRPPARGSFVKEVLAGHEDVAEPMELAVASDGRVYFVERRGAVKVFDPAVRRVSEVGRIPVYHEHEDGLLGLALDPDFGNSRQLYVMYSAPGDAFCYHISRFTLDDGGYLDLSSERVLLSIPQEHTESNHTGGSLAFDAAGNLYVSVGDNTNPFGDAKGFAPLDERPGRKDFDAQRSSGNTQDLRGKILRIRPRDDGGYDIPADNLFTDPEIGRREIYVMGTRNPLRISVDQKTSRLYWGDVGPDASMDSIQGPRGYDEINQAHSAGNFGWPYFVADNKAYRYIDFPTGRMGESYQPGAPLNRSPRNTGAKVLPPAMPAFIYYPYVKSERFPLLGEGGRSAMAGPVYRYDPETTNNTKLPSYFDGGLFIYDWIRNWIMVVRMDDHGSYLGMERFMPEEPFRGIIDMELGPDGCLYIVEYGTNWYSPNTDAVLSRLVYRPQMSGIAGVVDKREGNAALAPGHRSAVEGPTTGERLIADSDCRSCHDTEKSSIGPSFKSIAQRYRGQKDAVVSLADKVIRGGFGNWGNKAMNPHPQLSSDEAKKMVGYILNLE